MAILEKFPLNGADYFMLVLDRLMVKSSGWSNACRFVVELNCSISRIELELFLRQNHAFEILQSLRLKVPGFLIFPYWQVTASSAIPSVREFKVQDIENIPEKCFDKLLNPETDPPLRIDLVIYASGANALLFTWHHCLMDARGAELLLNHIGGNLRFDSHVADRRIKPDWKGIHTLKKKLYEITKLPLAFLHKKAVTESELRNVIITFSEDETRIIEENSRRSGAIHNRSLFFLAVSARAMRSVYLQRGNSGKDIFVPVPQDQRRRGAKGPMLRNQVSFLFYRIREDTLIDIRVVVRDLIDQMMQMMRHEIPASYLSMMEYSRRLPLFFYKRILKRNAGGQLASFFFSYTGDSLKDFAHFDGREINQAVHIPPNTFPPGIIIIFSNYRGRLNVTFGYMTSVIQENELETFISSLKSDLISV